MKRRGVVAAIDVGASKVVVLAAEPGDRGEVRLLGAGVAPAAGLSRGVIENIREARESVAIAVDKAEQAYGGRIMSAVVAISGAHISAQNNRGIIAIPDRARPVSEDDRLRVLDAAGNIAIPNHRQLLHVLPKGYWVDGAEAVSDPVGMFAVRLDAEAHIVTGGVSAIQNLTKVVESAGVEVVDFVLAPLAAARAVLYEQERQQGCAVVDIGASATSLVIYDQGSVAHTATLPIAGNHLTNDLTHVLRCPWESAEEVKCFYGAAANLDPSSNETVEVRTFGTKGTRIVPIPYIRDILQARTEELLEVVVAECRRAGLFDRIAAGLVFTGGGSQLAGLAEFAEARLGIPARVGHPRGYQGLEDIVGAPAYAVGIGLVEHELHGRDRPVELTHAGMEMPAGGIFRRIAAIGRALLPQ
jgi:cell division protein FtsA